MDRDIICGLLGRSKIQFKFDGKDTVTIENKNVLDVKFTFGQDGWLIKIEAVEDD